MRACRKVSWAVNDDVSTGTSVFCLGFKLKTLARVVFT